MCGGAAAAARQAPYSRRVLHPAIVAKRGWLTWPALGVTLVADASTTTALTRLLAEERLPELDDGWPFVFLQLKVCGCQHHGLERKQEVLVDADQPMLLDEGPDECVRDPCFVLVGPQLTGDGLNPKEAGISSKIRWQSLHGLHPKQQCWAAACVSGAKGTSQTEHATARCRSQNRTASLSGLA